VETRSIMARKRRNHEDPGADSALAEVKRLASLKQHAAALTKCSEIILRYPEHFEAYFRRAHVHIAMDNLREALEDLTRAITLNPKEPAFFFFSGLWLIKASRYEAAANAFSEAICLEQALDSSYYVDTARLGRAIAYFLANDLIRASTTLRDVSADSSVFAAGRLWTRTSLETELDKQRALQRG
jgi:tetratricopeptide (TPR) repeat protein